MAHGVQVKQGINDPRFVPSVWRSIFFLALSLASFSADLCTFTHMLLLMDCQVQ